MFHGIKVENREDVSTKAGWGFTVVKAKQSYEVAALPDGFVGEAVAFKDGFALPSKQVEGLQWYANVRTDNLTMLGIASEEYSVLQNSEVLDFMEDVAGRDGVQWLDAGTLYGGRRCFCNVKIGNPVNGVETILSASNSFDRGSKVGYTLHSQLEDGTKFVLNGLNKKTHVDFIHMGNLVEKHKMAAEALGLADEYSEAVRVKLAQMEMKGVYAEEFLKKLFKDSDSARGQTITLKNRDGVRSYITAHNAKNCFFAAAKWWNESDKESRLENILDEKAAFLSKAQAILEK